MSLPTETRRHYRTLTQTQIYTFLFVAEENFTALGGAIMFRQPNTILLLLEHGAIAYNHQKFGTSETFKHSPVGLAIQHYPDIMEVLLDHCEKAGDRIPLDLMFDLALKLSTVKHEQCAILALLRGYYPLVRDSDDHSNHPVFRAACKAFYKLMCLMIEMNPHFLQEEYFFGEWQLSNPLYQRFASWLAKHRKHAVSLQQLCRSKILSQLGQYYSPKIATLPLPQALKTYLRYLESPYKN